jgi:uncharacterized protein YndB with AHSA1/START domain
MPVNWNQFTKRINVSASPKAIYEAWSTQNGLESWFLRLAQFTKPDGKQRPRNSPMEKGDRYKWLWYGYDDSVVEENEIISANGWDEIKFKFAGNCIVTVNVRQEAGESICELTQEMPMENVDEKQKFYTECGEGWTFYLANLKSILQGGLDLRNKNEAIKKLVNA